MGNNNQLKELGILLIIGYLLFFNSTAVNPTLAYIYTILFAVSCFGVLGDGIYGKRQIQLTNQNISWGKALIISGISYIILIALSYSASSFAKIIPLKELLGLLATSAPVFSSSPFFNNLDFGFLIPYIESFAIFVVGIDFFSSMFKIDISRWNAKLLTLFIIISLTFLFYHVQAKGIENEPALILVFFMAMISCILVFLYKESRIPILFHIVCNTIALFSTGQFTSIPFIVGNSFLPLLKQGSLILSSLLIFSIKDYRRKNAVFHKNPKIETFKNNRKLNKIPYYQLTHSVSNTFTYLNLDNLK